METTIILASKEENRFSRILCEGILSVKLILFLNHRYEHPLLIEGRDKTEWVLPITVHAPPPRTPASGTRNDKLFSLDPSWVHN